MKINDVLALQLDRIRPSTEEIFNLKKISSDFIALLKKNDLNAFVGGSLAKGTMIRKTKFPESVQQKGDLHRCQVLGVGEETKQDVDIFVVFDYSEDILKLEKVLKKIKLPGKLKKVHGSRDYFQILCDNVVLEIIPVVKNSNPEIAENVTDVSLSHVKYICGEVLKSPGIADEIKLAKSFCQANRCYGAESYIHGFSGYSLEIMVIHFGGFLNFLKGVGRKRVLDPLKYFKNEKEILRELNSSKLQGPLILIDPTYKYRNVSAGLGKEAFEKFLVVAREFLKNPSLEYFERKVIDVEALKAFCALAGSNRRFVEVSLSTDRQNGDIAGTKMKKLFDFFVRELERKQQVVLKKEFDYSGGQVAKGYLVVVEKPEIEVKGPSVGLEEASKSFLKAKGKNAFEKKKFWWFKENVSIESVFEQVKKVEKEMGALGKISFK